MDKDDVIEIIKEKTEDFYFAEIVTAYVKGFLDALCRTYEISWDDRYEIEAELKETVNE